VESVQTIGGLALSDWHAAFFMKLSNLKLVIGEYLTPIQLRKERNFDESV
jgi:hypothetical protein